jgi:hypothetical protein
VRTHPPYLQHGIDDRQEHEDGRDPEVRRKPVERDAIAGISQWCRVLYVARSVADCRLWRTEGGGRRAEDGGRRTVSGRLAAFLDLPAEAGSYLPIEIAVDTNQNVR